MGSGTRPSVDSILVVEGDDETRDAVRAVLEDAGFAVHTARDGSEALALLRSERIALMLFDPAGINGRELRRRQLEDEALAAIPVVALTSEPAAGVDPVMVVRKPFEGDPLLHAIRAELDAAAAARHRSLLAAVSGVRKQMEKTINDLESVRRTSAPEIKRSEIKRRR